MSFISLIALTEDTFFASLFEFPVVANIFYIGFLLLCVIFQLLKIVLLADYSSPSVLLSDTYPLFDVLQGQNVFRFKEEYGLVLLVLFLKLVLFKDLLKVCEEVVECGKLRRLEDYLYYEIFALVLISLCLT